jgi:phosphatidylserine/phosphatidylglycerophosphate/cardiolipin synthase-like enzyme
MKLWVLPEDGLAPLLKGIDGAQASIDIMIFRFDRTDVEAALARAVSRGVAVRALVAHANKAGEDGLRQLEQRLLAAGVSVARTADDLVRYHGKMMIVDRHDLYLFAFNLTSLDTERTRSFGIVTNNRTLVQETIKLFEADTKRLPYTPRARTLVVSPANARNRLAAFIRGAKSEILIYDPAVSDPAMIRLLEERSRAGVTVRIIGRLARRSSKLQVHKLPRLRLHTRTMVRDRRHAFVGSQSLRAAELDTRREVGAIFCDRRAVTSLAKVFQEDWQLAETRKEQARADEKAPAEKVAKKLAKAVAKELPPVAPVLEELIKQMGVEKTELDLTPGEVEASVKDAVKAAVKEVVQEAVENVTEEKKEKESDAA